MKGKPGQRMLPLASQMKYALATPYANDRTRSRRNARAREKHWTRREIERQRNDRD